MVRARPGRLALGCLVPLVVVAAIGHYGRPVGEAFLRSWRFQDVMRQEARFATQHDDARIRARLGAAADSLGLPDAARQVRIVRGNARIRISATYVEIVEFPGTVRELKFTPAIEAGL